VQWHHIFPKSLLRKAGYEKAEINEIANIAFITGQTNRRLSNKEPGIYFDEIIAAQGQGTLLAQAIPPDKTLYKVENYRKFLEVRRAMLTETINTHMTKSLVG